MKPLHIKISLTAGAVVLFVLLFFAPRIAPLQGIQTPSQKGASGNMNTNQNLDVYYSMAVKTIDKDIKSRLDAFSEKAKTELSYFDSIALIWNQLKRPDFAARSVEEKAGSSKLSTDWIQAGNRYYYSVQFINDQSERPVLYASAARCFKKGLDAEPGNLDVKIMLASCMVEGSGNPMEGISLLREVEQVDSNNVKLQLTFAFFSVNSGQTDKAIRRFKKVLELDSTYLEAYLHLADIYEQRNEKELTVQALENYAKKTTDPTARLEVEKYIKQLKENINQ